eukprot:477486-Heterocapsa_arctica.AAC.1
MRNVISLNGTRAFVQMPTWICLAFEPVPLYLPFRPSRRGGGIVRYEASALGPRWPWPRRTS